MRAMLSLLLGLLVTVGSCPSVACDEPSKATPNSTCVVMPRGEQRGWWFDLKTGQQLILDAERTPHLEVLVDYWSQLASVRSLQVKSLERANADRLEAAQVSDRAVKEAREETARSERTQTVWVVVGVAGGLVVGAVAAAAVMEIVK